MNRLFTTCGLKEEQTLVETRDEILQEIFVLEKNSILIHNHKFEEILADVNGKRVVMLPATIEALVKV